MTDYTVITSFSPEGEAIYGMRFIEGFLEHWPTYVNLYVAHEGKEPDVKDERVRFLDLSLDKQLREFVEQHSNHVTTSKCFWRGAIKWCKKVFAATGWSPATDWWIWIDADVTHHAAIDGKWLERVLPEDKSLVFLGRPRLPYSECGFVGYRLTDKRVKATLKEMRRIFTSGEVFTQEAYSSYHKKVYPQWHDSFTFDVARKRSFGEVSDAYCNLAEGFHGWHPWEHTILQQKMTHHKGVRRKNREYGATT